MIGEVIIFCGTSCFMTVDVIYQLEVKASLNLPKLTNVRIPGFKFLRSSFSVLYQPFKMIARTNLISINIIYNVSII